MQEATAWAPEGPVTPAAPRSSFRAALAAAGVTIPHAVGLGVLAYAPLAGDLPIAALALWSAAVPGAIAALVTRRPGVVYAPTTVVALLYAAVLLTLSRSADALGLTPLQLLAACGATAALGFAFQWLFGALRLASLARFLPISVMHGFAAGVGLSMVLGQVRGGFGAGGSTVDLPLLLHALAALAVVGLAYASARRWPGWPGLLPAVVLVSVLIVAFAPSGLFAPAVPQAAFAWPPLPDYSGVPWLALVQRHGTQLVSLAFLMAVMNSLDVVVFAQSLALEHGLRDDPNVALRRESLVGMLCGLTGLVPASTSASRTRIVLAHAGPSATAGILHAGILLAIAATGHWWLHWIPMAVLAGGLLLAGIQQVPAPMWSRHYARSAPASWIQGWMVALIFPLAGGAGALIAGLAVATFVLLHASAGSSLRRLHLDGQLRSRRLRRAASESWLAGRMNRVAVIELQGVMSFGVAAHMTEQVRTLLQARHERVVLDAHRVPMWDATALAQLKALGRDMAKQGRQLAVCGLQARARAQLPATLLHFADVDRGLEWAEDALLAERPPAERPAYPDNDLLGELGEGIDTSGRQALEAAFERIRFAPGAPVFLVGDRSRDLHIVQDGRIAMGTAWPADTGLRLAKVGQGMAFGEMAFLNGEPRTACATAENGPAEVARLPRDVFDAWAAQHPREALVFLSNLALIGTRRLAATTRQLRAVLE